jgi:hypothetical protein
MIVSSLTSFDPASSVIAWCRKSWKRRPPRPTLQVRFRYALHQPDIGLAGSRRTSFWASPRETTDRQGSIGDKRVYTLRRRDAKNRIPDR